MSPKKDPGAAASTGGKTDGDPNKKKGDGDKKSDGDDDDKDTSGTGNLPKPKRKLKFDPPATAVIRVNRKLIKGSEEDFKKAKRVTDINYPIEPQFAELKGLKPQNVGEVEDKNALRLLKIKQKDPVDAEDSEKDIIPQPRETNKTCTQTNAQIERILADYGSENISQLGERKRGVH